MVGHNAHGEQAMTPTAILLYRKALEADQMLTVTVAIWAPGHTRWTLPRAASKVPAISAALARKVQADAEYLAFCRLSPQLP